MSEPEPPTPVTVTAPMRRNYSPSMFADLVRADVAWSKTITGQVAADGTKVWDVTFTGTEPGPALSDGEAACVWLRMASRDDDDQANRAALRAAAVAGATNLAQMLVAYTVGDPMPAAVLPEATQVWAAKATATKTTASKAAKK